MKYASLIFCAAVLSSGAFASANGGELIGLSPASQALGGTGVANYTNGVDAIYKNSALLGESTATGKVVAELYGTYFSQNASVNNGKSGDKDSQGKTRFAPQIAATYKIDDKLAVGLGIMSFGGATADFTGQGAAQSGSANPTEASLISLSQIKTTLNLVRIAPAVSYKFTDMISVGLSPFLSYGQFVINEDVGSTTATQSSREKNSKMGVGIGGGVTVKPTEGLLVGVSAHSKSKMAFENVLDLDKFGAPFLPNGEDNLTIENPFEIAGGVSYAVMPNLVFTLDYRFFNWAKAEGLKDLGWKDRSAVGAGVQYKMEKLALRVGYQYAKSPIEDDAAETGNVDVQGHTVLKLSTTKLALVGFPGIAEHHITLGGGYQITDDLGVDLSFVYAPKKTVSRGGVALSTPYTFTANVSQWSLAAGLQYRF